MRRRYKLLLAIGAITGLLVVAAWVYHWHLKAVNEAYIAQLVAQGEPMTVAQVLPPAVPPSENSAEVFLKATALLATDSSGLQTNSCHMMQMATPGKALVCSQLPQMHGYGATNPWPVLAQALETNQAALTLLLQVADHPALDFYIRYDHCLEEATLFTNLHLVELRKCEKYLKAKIMYCLHERDTADACRFFEAELALVQAMQNQPLQISQWVRMAMVHGLQSTCWEILQTPGITEEELARLQKDWEQLDIVHSSANALVMERAVGQVALGDWRQSTAALQQYLAIGKNARITLGISDETESLPARISQDLQVFLWQYWWSYPDELRTLKGYQVLLGASRQLETNRIFQTAIADQEAGLKALQITNSPDVIALFFFELTDTPNFHTLLSESVENLSGTMNKVLIAETIRQMTITAIALQRFKLAHGQYPTQLGELVPAFVEVVPRDPVDGQALRYRPQSDGNFLLYSVGENGVDDGGNPAPDDADPAKSINWFGSHNLDWVWPQPVRPENRH